MPGAGTDRSRNWPEFGGPGIMLHEPQVRGNIGASAGAIANFGLAAPRLVRPRDGWPNLQAQRSASGADRVLEAVRLHDTIEAAIADCTVVFATPARGR